MQIEELSLSAIKPYEKNPRKNDEAVNGVAESIKQFGFQQPIVIDAKWVIVGNRVGFNLFFCQLAARTRAASKKLNGLTA